MKEGETLQKLMSLSTSISFSCLCFYESHSLTTHSKWKSFGRKNLSSSSLFKHKEMKRLRGESQETSDS